MQSVHTTGRHTPHDRWYRHTGRLDTDPDIHTEQRTVHGEQRTVHGVGVSTSVCCNH